MLQYPCYIFIYRHLHSVCAWTHHGLNLRVDLSGARQWVQRLVIRGRPRMLGLGGYPLVSLAEARNVAFANRQRPGRAGTRWPRSATARA